MVPIAILKTRTNASSLKDLYSIFIQSGTWISFSRRMASKCYQKTIILLFVLLKSNRRKKLYKRKNNISV
jgi:hypothetical protein